jgi:hypothetical protein
MLEPLAIFVLPIALAWAAVELTRYLNRGPRC